VTRYGSMLLPMDEALILTAVDLSGRGMLCYDLHVPTQKVGTFDTELVEEFLIALARRGDMTIHVRQLAGSNSHHIIESAFKALARALRMAVAIDPAQANEIRALRILALHLLLAHAKGAHGHTIQRNLCHLSFLLSNQPPVVAPAITLQATTSM